MYTINQLAKKLKIPVSTIRYYEKKGVILPKRASNNYRVFTKSDKNQLKLILVMKYAGFTLKQIKEFFALSELSEATCKVQTETMIHEKKAELFEKITTYQLTLHLLDTLEPLAINNVSSEAENALFKQVDYIFKTI